MNLKKLYMGKKLKSTLIIGIVCVFAILVVCLLIHMIENRIEKQIDKSSKIENAVTIEISEVEEADNITIEQPSSNVATAQAIRDELSKYTSSSEVITEKVADKEFIDFITLDAPKNNTIKSYMGYKSITSKSSRQYKLQESLAYTGDHGLRMVNDRYCVALGSYYTTTIGQYVDIKLENGKVIKGILSDCKSDRHTDSTHRMHPDGSVVEFVVDSKSLDKSIKNTGDVSHVNGWDSKVVSIKVYNKVEEF